MVVDWALVSVLAVIFLATLVRSTFGFGEALFAVPLLALLLPVEIAAPLAVLLSITVAGVIVMQDWEHIHLTSAWWLILSTLCGIPLGLLLLREVEEAIVKSVLALVIMGFSLFCLFSRGRFELRNDRLAWLFGFVAGILGGAYGINGPPLVIYAALRRWSPQHLRATLQGYFLPASVVGLVGYWLAGFWVSAVTRYYLLSLPAALAAIVLGRMVNRRLKGQAFLVYVYLGLIVAGGMLLLQSLGLIKPPLHHEIGARQTVPSVSTRSMVLSLSSVHASLVVGSDAIATAW